MSAKPKAFEYSRTLDTRGVDLPYKEKFAHFLRAIGDAKAQNVYVMIVPEAWMLGDTYEEIMESLSHLAGTGIGVCMAKP